MGSHAINHKHDKIIIQNAVEKLKFNQSRCASPLVSSNHKDEWFPGIDECGIQCKNPLYTDEEHAQVHTLIKISGSLCLICTVFTVVSHKPKQYRYLYFLSFVS